MHIPRISRRRNCNLERRLSLCRRAYLQVFRQHCLVPLSRRSVIRFTAKSHCAALLLIQRERERHQRPQRHYQPFTVCERCVWCVCVSSQKRFEVPSSRGSALPLKQCDCVCVWRGLQAGSPEGLEAIIGFMSAFD